MNIGTTFHFGGNFVVGGSLFFSWSAGRKLSVLGRPAHRGYNTGSQVYHRPDMQQYDVCVAYPCSLMTTSLHTTHTKGYFQTTPRAFWFRSTIISHNLIDVTSLTAIKILVQWILEFQISLLFYLPKLGSMCPLNSHCPWGRQKIHSAISKNYLKCNSVPNFSFLPLHYKCRVSPTVRIFFSQDKCGELSAHVRPGKKKTPDPWFVYKTVGHAFRLGTTKSHPLTYKVTPRRSPPPSPPTKSPRVWVCLEIDCAKWIDWYWLLEIDWWQLIAGNISGN